MEYYFEVIHRAAVKYQAENVISRFLTNRAATKDINDTITMLAIQNSPGKRTIKYLAVVHTVTTELSRLSQIQ